MYAPSIYVFCVKLISSARLQNIVCSNVKKKLLKELKGKKSRCYSSVAIFATWDWIPGNNRSGIFALSTVMKPRENSFCAPRFIDAIGLGLAISLACLREVVNARLKRKSPTEMLQKRFLHGYTLLESERDTIAASSPVSRLHRGDRESLWDPTERDKKERSCNMERNAISIANARGEKL